MRVGHAEPMEMTPFGIEVGDRRNVKTTPVFLPASTLEENCLGKGLNRAKPRPTGNVLHQERTLK